MKTTEHLAGHPVDASTYVNHGTFCSLERHDEAIEFQERQRRAFGAWSNANA